jgi:hypothetical protein
MGHCSHKEIQTGRHFPDGVVRPVNSYSLQPAAGLSSTDFRFEEYISLNALIKNEFPLDKGSGNTARCYSYRRTKIGLTRLRVILLIDVARILR